MSLDEVMRPTAADPIAITRRPPVGGLAAVGTRRAYALAVLSGVIYACAFPPLSWSAAAWCALVPLLVGCAMLTPARAALAGLCWTAAAAVGVAGFLPHMLSSYFGLGTVTSWAAALAAVVGLNGVYVCAFAAWVAWLAQRRAAHPLLIAAGWVACELARAAGTLGSGWALTAYSQLDDLRLIQSADLFGPYGIGLLIAAVNACVAMVFAPALRGRRPLRSAAAVTALLALTFLYGGRQLAQSFDAGPAVRVAVVQGGAPPADPAERAAHLERYVDLTRRGVDAHTQLVVWPESTVAAYLEEPSATRTAVLRLADELHTDLLLGAPHYESSPAGTRYHNSAYLVRDGRLAARYDKHRLVPFAEDGTLAASAGDAPFYSPGTGGFVLPATGLHIGAALCVESMAPELMRAAVREGADILANLSNDVWFGDAAAARQQLASATLRAVENRRYLIRAAATGISAVIDPFGRPLAAGGFGTTHVLNATVRAARTRTPYQLWGDAVAWLVAATAALATLRARRAA
jgi:apolipoprotein N-acyltransferase